LEATDVCTHVQKFSITSSFVIGFPVNPRFSFLCSLARE
jgi:hypothetical protein